MRAKLPKVLVTGGAGFIGSAFVRLALKRGYKIVVADKLTYAGDLKRLEEVKGEYKFYRVDICRHLAIDSIFRKERPSCVVNFSAETHVDRSIIESGPFIETNIKGTKILLDLSRKYNITRVLHISTDEVYGEIKKGSFSEESPLRPNSPYAASKAAADLLINAYVRTYRFPAIIIRPSNNYGPWQYPEKFIPLAILQVLKNGKIPVYGKGKNVREWLYVDDCAQAILEILEKGKIGEVYNIGSNQERENIGVALALIKAMGVSTKLIAFVKDRPGHDIRYRLNCRKVREEIGWLPRINFNAGLKRTIYWYIKHKDWLFNKRSNIKYSWGLQE